MNTLQLKELFHGDPVVITGMGTISCAGSSIDELWRAVCQSRKTFEIIKLSFGGSEIEIPVCRVKEIPFDEEIALKVNKYDRTIKLGVYAALQSLTVAKIHGKQGFENTGAIVGTSRGAIEQLSSFLSSGNLKKTLPSYSSNTSFGAVSGVIAKILGIKGIGMTISANCASGAISMIISAQQLALGLVDGVVCGGTEAPLEPHVIASMANAGILTKSSSENCCFCKPFDVNRDGTILGEGAGFAFLERMSVARKRSSNIYAALAGFAYGITSGPPMGVDTSGRSLADLIKKALVIAGIRPEDVSFVNLHGTGTRANDLSEARAIEQVFGRSNPEVPVFSIKPVTGHCLGASSAIESIVCVKALNEGLIPPTANCSALDPECKINVVREKAQKVENAKYALSISAGFWGYKAVMVFKKL